jgi:hypothetical protein
MPSLWIVDIDRCILIITIASLVQHSTIGDENHIISIWLVDGYLCIIYGNSIRGWIR